MNIKSFLTMSALLCISAAAQAQGWVEAPGVVRDHSTVSVQVRNQVAQVEVEEWFRNSGGAMGQADYIFPMPDNAVFTSYSLFEGDTELRGEVMDAAAARRIYEEIVRRRKDPALIELAGRGLVRARVFPIAPGETRRVVLRYTQPLVRAGDAYEFRYPAPQRNDAARVAVNVTVDNEALYRDAVSPTHGVRVRRTGGVMKVTPQDEVRSDFSLLLPLAHRDVGIAVSTHRDDATEDGFFMLRLSPGESARAVRVARDVTVVLDVSGSMSGEKLEQAKSALRQLLGTLGESDRFRMIKFSGASSEWRSDWSDATSANVESANDWVDALRAEGGTNIGEALADAFRVATPSSRLGVVVFLTDGLPSVGEQNPERIAAVAERSAGKTRVFAFGVGHDVNTYLLDRLGAAGRGGAQYVQPGESVETALGTLAAKIQYPVLTDLALSASGVTLREIYPTTLPDLFGGEDLVIFGRYRASSVVASTDRSIADAPRNASGVVTITGQRAGHTERYSTRVAFPVEEQGNAYMPRLWAARKLGELTRRIHINGRDPELIEEIKATALRYGLLSEYTSYFVAEPGAVSPSMLVPRDGTASRSIVPNALPQVDVTTGANAVASSEAARKQREVATSSQLDALDKATAERVAGPAGNGSHRVVDGRTFDKRDGVWVDAAAAGKKTIDIAAYSDAYFAIIRSLPELKSYTMMGDVAVAGAGIVVRITPTGAKTLSYSETEAVVKQFRGTTVRR